jgi:hypothetical protein
MSVEGTSIPADLQSAMYSFAAAAHSSRVGPFDSIEIPALKDIASLIPLLFSECSLNVP